MIDAIDELLALAVLLDDRAVTETGIELTELPGVEREEDLGSADLEVTSRVAAGFVDAGRSQILVDPMDSRGLRRA